MRRSQILPPRQAAQGRRARATCPNPRKPSFPSKSCAGFSWPSAPSPPIRYWATRLPPASATSKRCLDRLEAAGIYAIEVIPTRNTRERLTDIVSAAQRRWWPVFNGTEHNTPEARPLLDPFALDPEFEPWFRQSAAVLLAHQAVRGTRRAGVCGRGRPAHHPRRARSLRTVQSRWRMTERCTPRLPALLPPFPADGKRDRASWLASGKEKQLSSPARREVCAVRKRPSGN